MKPQTKEEILALGHTEEVAAAAVGLFELLRPGLKVKRHNGRVETVFGDKTVLGLYLTLRSYLKEV